MPGRGALISTSAPSSVPNGAGESLGPRDVRQRLQLLRVAHLVPVAGLVADQQYRRLADRRMVCGL